MNLISSQKLTIVLMFLCLAFSRAAASGQVILTETFDAGTSGTTFLGQSSSDGNAQWVDALGKNTTYYTDQYKAAAGNFTSTFGNLFVLGGHSDVLYLNYSLSALNSVTINIGQLQINSVCNFYIGARMSNVTSTYCTYQLTNTGAVSYIDGTGAATSIGTLSGGAYNTNISLVVTETTQQLYVNGTAFDTQARATQAAAGGAAQYFALNLTASANAGTYLDTITYTVVPEPTGMAYLGIGLASLALCEGRLRRRRN